MDNIKEHFRDWLVEKGLSQRTEAGNPSTIYDYIKTLERICKRSFRRSDEQGWKILADNIYQELSKQYEYSNADYFLDKINIRYALYYLHKITTFIYSNVGTEEENCVNLYLNFKDKDYLIKTVKLNELFQHVLLFDEYVFQHRHKKILLNSETADFFIETIHQQLRNFIYPLLDNKADLFHYITLHISYLKHPRKEKTALFQFHTFLYPKVDATTNDILCFQQNENPRNKKGGNYIITKDISGNNPLCLDINPNNNLESYDDYADKNASEEDERFIIIKDDMPKIFDVAYNSVDTIIEKAQFKNFQVQKRVYYSVDSVNSYLKKKFHTLKKKHNTVLYDEKGYEHWCDRAYATKQILKISLNRFYDCVNSSNCTYIDYLKNKPKYFIPDLKYLTNSRPVRKARISTKKYNKSI